MVRVLQNKRIVLGVTGSIACYKAVELASQLTQAGAMVDVVLTAAAAQFITPLTFRSLTHRPVVTDLMDPDSEQAVEHVALATKADLLVIAPATAHTIARLALGLADDALSAVALASRAPLLVAPAMDAGMFEHPALQDNLARLQARGAHIVGPAEGRLASGLVGKGRMVEPQELLGHIRWVLGKQGDLAGRKVVVSAGGTQEPLDPVRVLTNRSSGKMGYAVAEAARDRGAQVVLVTAPTALPSPVGVQMVRVQAALEMRDSVLAACRGADALVMAAAVADYRPASFYPQKVKKGPQQWVVELTKNPDILAEAPRDLIRVGFAAETEKVVEHAQEKLVAKGLDLMVANDVTSPDSGFGTDTNRVVILDKDGGCQELPLLSKLEVADRILDRVAELLARGLPRR
ncbi:MAG: bifunctional phosphopantothenoylcysteine decarboxylase/phosphopantothenate--cysteine ligase CoaBC [Chloroflexi bacterium]|nr:bifunctional phosphopantothenoylcysteine decarboxylase/phosphopantothenate--cysteine ligase CoaBC [Chloroflexota bacterium]